MRWRPRYDSVFWRREAISLPPGVADVQPMSIDIRCHGVHLYPPSPPFPSPTHIPPLQRTLVHTELLLILSYPSQVSKQARIGSQRHRSSFEGGVHANPGAGRAPPGPAAAARAQARPPAAVTAAGKAGTRAAPRRSNGGRHSRRARKRCCPSAPTWMLRWPR